MNFIFIIIFPLLTCHIIAEPQTAILTTESYNPEVTLITSKANTYGTLISKSQVVIDKSLLLKDIIEDNGTYYLISFPQGWGKSVNLDMMHRFFRLETSSEKKNTKATDATPKNITDHEFYAILNGNASQSTTINTFTTPLLITQYKNIIETHMGQYPVIYIYDLKDLFNGENDRPYEILGKKLFRIAKMKSVKSELLKIMRGTIEHPTINKTLAKQFADSFSLYETPRDLNAQQQSNSLFILSKILYYYYQKKIIIMIDDYDAPWVQLFTKGMITKEKHNKVLSLFYMVFIENSIARNGYIEKVIMTGETPITRELRRKLPSGVIECNVWTGKFAQYYGFNQWEIDKFSNYLNFTEEQKNNITSWYGGYVAMRTDLQLHHPRSIATNVQNFEEKSNLFGKRSLANDLGHNLFRHAVHALVEGQNYSVEFCVLNIDEVELKCKIDSNKITIPSMDKKFLMKGCRFLFLSGLITYSRNKPDLNSTSQQMRIPNQQTLLFLKKNLRNYFELMLELRRMDKEEIKDSFDQFVRNNDLQSTRVQEALEPILVHICNNESIHMLASWLFLDTEFIQKYINPPKPTESRPNFVLILPNRAVIVNFKYNAFSQEVLMEQTKSYRHFIDLEKHSVEKIKYISVNVFLNKTIEIFSEISAVT